ncbi:MAG TPA: TrkA family potassium uptake protein [Candidatus Limnocylindrales bacterium]|nr:TrkA family potassium uptake protein [Candidatus Limnocylindrales bacterium]
MFVLVVGGGKVGYYLTKELVAAGHEIVLMEKDAARAAQIADEIGSIVLPHDGCEGRYLAAAGCNRADVVAAVTGDDEDNLVICQMAKHHFDVPRSIARVNNPKNEDLFRHLGVDEIISPTRMILGSIEQDIPVHELLHLAALGESDLEIIEAQLQPASPAVGRSPRDLAIPATCSLFAVVRDGEAEPLAADTVLRAGDKVIAIGRAECESRLRDELLGGPADGEEPSGELQTSALGTRTAPASGNEPGRWSEGAGSRGPRRGASTDGRPDDAAR